MIINSQDKKSQIELEFLDIGDKMYPSLEIKVSIINNEFAGSVDVSIKSEGFELFLAELKVLSDTRNGSVGLRSMDQSEFDLQIESYDQTGHLRLKYEIMKIIYMPDLNRLKLSGAFILDSEYINQIYKDFNNLNYPPNKIHSSLS